MKICMITYPKIEDGKGRFLQAYCLYSALQNLGHSVEIINYRPEGFSYSLSVKRIIKNILKNPGEIKSYYAAFKKKVFSNMNKNKTIESENNYLEFIHHSIKYNLKVVSKEQLNEIANGYDAYICGSDQIWNPYFSCGRDSVYYLAFAPSYRRIAYAASFGTLDIPKNAMSQMIPLIEGIPYISIREKKSRDELESKYGIVAEHVCDPTFLMSQEWWNDFASEKTVNTKYILLYVFDNNPKPRLWADALSKKTGYKVVAVSDSIEDCLRPYIKVGDMHPKQFTSLFKNAEIVLTQSFHGVVMSILYNRPFWVFDRKEAGQVSGLILRIQDLLSTYSLEDRIIYNDDKCVPEARSINYFVVNMKIAQERGRSLTFLEKSLKKIASKVEE